VLFIQRVSFRLLASKPAYCRFPKKGNVDGGCERYLEAVTRKGSTPKALVRGRTTTLPQEPRNSNQLLRTKPTWQVEQVQRLVYLHAVVSI